MIEKISKQVSNKEQAGETKLEDYFKPIRDYYILL